MHSNACEKLWSILDINLISFIQVFKIYVMKRFLFIVLILSAVTAKANPGDSTWVQAHYDKWLTNVGNYDTTITFPGGTVTYRKIYMIFTLGKYQCPGAPTYCGDWDYMAQTYLMTPAGDSIELGRLITPYANASYPRTPWTWKERYIFDVTDYYPLLKNNATIRLRYSGSTGGFTANIKFVFIEGVPDRNVLGITPLWRGDFSYGSTANPIENKITLLNETAPVNAQSAAMKFIITGHRSDNSGCSEFCKKYYQVLVNGNLQSQTDIWRDNCGFNHMYPQSGTWVYNRGNWCPGDLVKTNTHVLQGISSGSNYTLDVDFEPYTTTATAPPYYSIGAAIIYYGGLNKTLDASLDDIIAPTNYEGHYRENPLSGKPSILLHNSGSTTITSLKIEYGLPGNLVQYNWVGSLVSLEETQIDLPEPPGLRNATGSNNIFTVKILQVNNQTDQDNLNNSLSSEFTAAPHWPNTIVVRLKTNASSVGGVSETEWKLYNGTDNLIAQRTNNTVNTQYSDTISLSGDFYKLVLTDQGCDGINWWANPGGGVGTFQVKAATGPFPFTLGGYFNGDFGCGFTQHFTVDGPSGVTVMNSNETVAIEAYPNPAQNYITISIHGLKKVEGNLIIADAFGRTVAIQNCSENNTIINTEQLSNGMYKAIFYDYNNHHKIQVSFLIAK